MDFDAFDNLLSHQRAIRQFDLSRAVDDATIEKVLRVATYAPSSHNSQPWRFIVIRDLRAKAQLGKIFDELGATMAGRPPDHTLWQDVPALIAVVADENLGAAAGAASIYPAVQNLLLAAHALGLGTVLTTRWERRKAEVRPVLNLPEEADVVAIVPIGWPDRRYGRGKRKPVAEVTFRESYGQKW